MVDTDDTGMRGNNAIILSQAVGILIYIFGWHAGQFLLYYYFFEAWALKSKA